MNNWSDQKKWWMDLLRSLVTFVIVAIVTIFIIESYNARRDDSRDRAKVHLQKLQEIEKEFESASLLYFNSIHYSFLWKLGEKYDPDIVQKFISPNQTEKFISVDKERYDLALAKVDLYFPKLESKINNLMAENFILVSSYSSEDKNTFYDQRVKTLSLAKELIFKLNDVIEASWNSLIEDGSSQSNN